MKKFKATWFSKREARENQYQSMKEAVSANKCVEKEEWLKAVRCGGWAVSHYDTAIVFKYRDGISEIERYVNLIPDSEFAEFVTVYGAYLKQVFVTKYGNDYIRSKKIQEISLQNPVGFFPATFEKGFVEHLQGLIALYGNKNCIVMVM